MGRRACAGDAMAENCFMWARMAVCMRYRSSYLRRPDIGTPVAMFDISLEARGALHAPLGFDISADGNRFLAPIAVSSERSEIVVIQNWEAGLKAATPK